MIFSIHVCSFNKLQTTYSDDEDFDPKVPVVSDKWEGEDEDEDLKDNWDDDEEEKPKGSSENK